MNIGINREPMKPRQLIHQILTVEKWLLNSTLCLLLMMLILLACIQIGLRTFFSGGLLWADPLLRYLVLWCGMLGAVVATREKKHIAIDVVGYLAPEQLKPWIGFLLDLFSTLVAATLTWAAVTFVSNERLFGGSPLLNIPTWVWYLIFPITFTLITTHFLLATTVDIRILCTRFQSNEMEKSK
jgi:TRAP-type C4-dicarboxylate transport system permease small subunit